MKSSAIEGKSQRQGITAENLNNIDLTKVIQLEKEYFVCSESGNGTCEQTECGLRTFCFSCG
jgi:hypothetical protein